VIPYGKRRPVALRWGSNEELYRRFTEDQELTTAAAYAPGDAAQSVSYYSLSLPREGWPG